MYEYNHSFCPAERRSAWQNYFRDPEVPDHIYRRYTYTEVTIRSARQNTVIGDILVRIYPFIQPVRTPFCPAEHRSAG